MRVIAFCFLLLPLLLSAQNSSETDERAIHAVMDQFMEAWNHHDAKAFAAVFSEDADFTNVRGVSATMFSKSHQEYTDIKTRFLRPDVAAVDVRWKMTGSTDPQGNPRPEREGLLNFLMEKHDGRWEVVVMHNLETSAAAPPSPK